MTGSTARASRSNPLTGSAFIRSLAALNGVHAPASHDDFAQRVSQWFGWTHAFSLSAALSDVPERTSERPTESLAAARPGVGLDADEREYRRVRAALAKLAETPRDPPSDFIGCRHRYITCQQTMESQIAPLRRRLRATLAAGSPAMAQLARLDSVMEQVVGAQERALLSTVSGLLKPRFEQLRRSQAQMEGEGDEAQAPGPWLHTFHRDMRALLLTELDLRLQPVEGLLDASRPPPSDRHE